MGDQKSLIMRTDFVFFPIRNFERADEFYREVLGLERSKCYANDLGGEYETGSLTIQLVDMTKLGREVAPSTGAIALHVQDVESAREELESRGVQFDGEIVDSGVCYQAYFHDPDGNALILHHRYAPPGVLPGGG